MADEDKYKYLNKNIKFKDKHDDETGGESGEGGKSGAIEFHDFTISKEHIRDDQLSPEEKKRLLIVHRETHEGLVKKQKEVRDQRKLLKEGKIPLQNYRQGVMSGMNSQYKSHPMLSNKAQFSGIDRQTNMLPNENVANTNDELRNELENQYRLRYQPENAPKFNPKPQYR